LHGWLECSGTRGLKRPV